MKSILQVRKDLIQEIYLQFNDLLIHLLDFNEVDDVLQLLSEI